MYNQGGAFSMYLRGFGETLVMKYYIQGDLGIWPGIIGNSFVDREKIQSLGQYFTFWVAK